MANKNNIRSIRFSDEMTELIDQQIGGTFTAKLENLVTKCVWELPAKEKELERIREQIKAEEKKLVQIIRNRQQLERTSAEIQIQVQQSLNLINKGIGTLKKLIDEQ